MAAETIFDINCQVGRAGAGLGLRLGCRGHWAVGVARASGRPEDVRSLISGQVASRQS